MTGFTVTAETDLLAIEDALECAIKHTDEELGRKRSAPYARALEAQKSRYQDLLKRAKEAK